jgi:hypothetical protein
MIVINIDNDHLMTHRYGWHKIVFELLNTVNSDLILVDFMDKYFNLWFELPKNIMCQGNNLNFINKDAYYYIDDPEKNDVFIYTDNMNLYYPYKWYPEYNEFKLMKGEIIQHFKKKINSDVINKPWVGILHYPEFVEEMNYESYEALTNLIKSDTFIKSLKNCKCIITLSEHLKEYLDKILNENNFNILTKNIYHPTDFNCKTFNLQAFNKNKEKKIVQIGFWMRKMNTIYEINSKKYIKYWLPGGQYWKDIFTKIYSNYQSYLDDKSVTIKMYLSNDDYDDLLIKNVALLDVFNSSANNTILECIARNTPLLVNKHPAIVEYLGVDYPLYFNNTNELQTIIDSDNFISKITASYNYLKNMNKQKFKIKSFCEDFNNILKSI